MPKQVAKHIMEIIRSKICLMCKSMLIHCRNNVFLRFSRWRSRAETNQRTIKNDIHIHSQINEKPLQNQCSKKWWQNDGKLSQDGLTKVTRIEKKIWKSGSGNFHWFWWSAGGGTRPWGSRFPPVPGDHCAQYINRYTYICIYTYIVERVIKRKQL